MRPGRARRLTGLCAAVALVFAGGWFLGSTAGPAPGVDLGPLTVALPQSDPVPDDSDDPDGGPAEPGAAAEAGPGGGTADPETAPMGLVSTRAGYTLTPVTTVLPAHEPTEIAFTVVGSDGAPVRAFEGSEPVLDAAVVRRDAAGYATLRVTPGPDGVWRAPMTFPGAGVWRLYVGFTPTGGPPLDLGADLFVPGPFGPFTFGGEERAADSGEFRLRLDGDLLPGGRSRVFVTIGRDGAPVTDLRPVPGTGGAFGRLVAVRQGDLARIPLQPEIAGADPSATVGPAVGFTGTLPSTGSYRLFLTFTQDGVDRTGEFTVDALDGS